ncbi:MAG: dihydrofolate reductase [Geobacter sp.]|nr:dihydrofolate reductase [Geobacter sp.]
MIISLIAALSTNRVIGRAGTIPWDIPADRRCFRELTTGHPLIMGRKTFESIGRPLPGRRIIVLSRQEGYRPEGVEVAGGLAAALSLCAGDDEVFVAGGGEIYGQALPLAHRLYLTEVEIEVAGDTYFPPLPEGAFAAVRRELLAAEPRCTLVVYERTAAIGPVDAAPAEC